MRTTKSACHYMNGFIYLLSAFHTKLQKLGWTDNFARRLSQVRRGNADQISVVWVVQGSHEDEREMHRSPDLKHYHEHDEFYRDEPGARETIFSLLPVGSTPETSLAACIPSLRLRETRTEAPVKSCVGDQTGTCT